MIFIAVIGILAAMFRFFVIVFGIVWASLLLLSWSSAAPPVAEPLQPRTAETSLIY